MKENNEKKINNEHEISKLIKAFPKDIAALDMSNSQTGDWMLKKLIHHLLLFIFLVLYSYHPLCVSLFFELFWFLL